MRFRDLGRDLREADVRMLSRVEVHGIRLFIAFLMPVSMLEFVLHLAN
jgi:hypothetical protein